MYPPQPAPAPNFYPPYPQMSAPKKGPNVGLIIGGVFLVLILLGGGILVYTATKHSNPGTASTSSATPATQATPAAPALFSDNFANNSKNWDTKVSAGYGASISNNMLTMKEANHRIFQEPVPTSVPNDFTVTTTFTLVQGDRNDSVGLQMRSSSDNSRGYVVEIYGDDTYDIVKIAPDPNDNTKLKFSSLSDPASAPTLKTKGQPNTLSVIMKGSDIVVSINGTKVKAINDTAFSNGSINLFLANGDTSTGAVATFSSLAVYAAPAQLPS